jgi:hypothetical protein
VLFEYFLNSGLSVNLVGLAFETNIVNEYLAGTTRYCSITSGTKTNGNPVNVRQVDALIGKLL